MKTHYFPYDRYRIRTRYSMEQVQMILYYHIASDRFDGKEFYGKRYEDSFKVSPVTFWKSNSLIVIRGELVQEKDGIVIEVTARPRIFVRVWLALCVVPLFMSIVCILGGNLGTAIYFLPFWLVFGLFRVFGGVEMSVAKENLHKIFGYPIEDYYLKNKKAVKF